MSSTNRSSRSRKGSKYDYYVTPVPVIQEELLPALEEEIPSILQGSIIDPCAGGDFIKTEKHPEGRGMSYLEALYNYGVPLGNIATMDIREDSRASKKGDYLKTVLPFKPFLIITNPPFNLAIEIIKKALDDVEEGGYVVMLLRLNFFGSDKRRDFWRHFMPLYAFIHHKRISFTEDGKTDSIEYAHFVWKKGEYPEYTKVKVI